MKININLYRVKQKDIKEFIPQQPVKTRHQARGKHDPGNDRSEPGVLVQTLNTKSV